MKIDFLEKVENIFIKEGRLLRLKAGKVVFVGDTHGDLEATEIIFKKYLKKYKIVFLGDYVDRGPNSLENIELILKTKIKYPDEIFLLMGNHEGWGIAKSYPADFWQSLSGSLAKLYQKILLNLSFSVVTKDIITLHGALPDVQRAEEIENIKLGDKNWWAICWGDFKETGGEELGEDPFTGRPQFGKDYFEKVLKRLDKKILIRSHQPYFPQVAFDKKCFTLFTSSAYGLKRTIIIADLKQKICSTDDLIIEII